MAFCHEMQRLQMLRPTCLSIIKGKMRLSHHIPACVGAHMTPVLQIADTDRKSKDLTDKDLTGGSNSVLINHTHKFWSIISFLFFFIWLSFLITVSVVVLTLDQELQLEDNESILLLFSKFLMERKIL